MAANYTDEELMQVLTSAQVAFREWKMPRTVAQIQYLIDEINRSEIIRSYFNVLFKNLQTVSELEFGSTPYRKKILDYLNQRIRLAMTVRIDQVEAMNKDPVMVDFVYDRMNANRVFTAVNKILLKGSETPYEKTIGLSYAYSAIVEGVYKKSIQDCYAWERIGSGTVGEEPISSIANTDIGAIIKYYNENSIDKSIFEGYSNTIRNSVAHFTMYYNENTNKMTYKDRKSGKEITIDREELYQFYTKVWDVYFMVLAKNQLLSINDACANFVQRKASLQYP